MNKFHLNLGVYISVAMLLFGSAIFIQSTKMKYWSGYGPGDAFVSIWSSGFLMFFALISVYQTAKESGIKLSQVLPKDKSLKNLLITWASLIFFLIVVQEIGFLVTSSIMMVMLYSRGYKWYYATALGIGVTLICFFLFKTILQVPVPLNQFGW